MTQFRVSQLILNVLQGQDFCLMDATTLRGPDLLNLNLEYAFGELGCKNHPKKVHIRVLGKTGDYTRGYATRG